MTPHRGSRSWPRRRGLEPRAARGARRGGRSRSRARPPDRPAIRRKGTGQTGSRRAPRPARGPGTRARARCDGPRVAPGSGRARAVPGARAARATGRSQDRHPEYLRRDALVNHLIEPLAFLRRRQRRPAERAGGELGEGSGGAEVARALTRRQHEVLGALHAHELRREVQQQRGVQLATVHRAVLVLHVAGEVEGEDVDREDPGPLRAQRRERLLVRVVAVRRQDDERVDAGLLPRAEQIVDPAVQGLATHGCVAGVRPPGRRVHAVLDGGGAQDVEGGREIVRQTLDDDRVASQRQMGAVLFAGAHRHQEAGIALEDEANLVRKESLEVSRRSHVVIAGCATALAGAEWLHGSVAGWAWAAATAGLAGAAVFLARKPRGIVPGLAALAGVVLGALVIAGALEVRRIECCWPDVRAGRIPRDSADLKRALAAAVAEAQRLAERGVTAALLPRQAAFAPLAEALQERGQAPGLERGAVILEADGEPVAWAGRHRFVPARDTAELRAVITPFYASLEARRQTQRGGTAVGSVLLDAAPAAPDRGDALSVRLERRHGVGLRFYPPRLAPADANVFDYATPDGPTLFSVQPIAPSQGEIGRARVGKECRSR